MVLQRQLQARLMLVLLTRLVLIHYACSCAQYSTCAAVHCIEDHVVILTWLANVPLMLLHYWKLLVLPSIGDSIQGTVLQLHPGASPSLPRGERKGLHKAHTDLQSCLQLISMPSVLVPQNNLVRH